MIQPTPSYERYQRQMILPSLGLAGQQTLMQASVLVVGAGGLGCPVLQYAVAAGIGNIGIIDDDTVALHNLHRQVLYTTADIGKPKADTAAARLRQMNPEVTITVYNERLTTANCLSIFQHYDWIADGTDNFATRYMINDACVLLGKPLVFGAISRFEGQVSVFNKMVDDKPAVHYRDLFPQPPKAGEVLNCAEAGVIGVLPGIVGGLMASELIKGITGIGQLLSGKLLTMDLLTQRQQTWAISKHPDSDATVPANAEAFKATNYEWLCGLTTHPEEIEQEGLETWVKNTGAMVVDVREWGEWPPGPAWSTVQIPLSMLKDRLPDLQEKTVLFYCQSGKRSLQAVQWLKESYGHNALAYSLKGGIQLWTSMQQKTPL